MEKRKKKVIKGTAALGRIHNENYDQFQPVSSRKVGKGRYDGGYIGGYLGPRKYIDKKTGKKETEREYEVKKRLKGFREENWEPSKPSSLVKRKSNRK